MASAAVATAVRQYGSATETLRGRVLRFVGGRWDGLESYRDADVIRFADAVAPVVTAGQSQAASLTSAYLENVGRAVLGKAKTVGIPKGLFTDAAMRGVDAHDVYRRPGVTVWTALAKGVLPTDAFAHGRQRALAIAATDLQLAETHAARHVLTEAGDAVTGFRRVTLGKCCSLCSTASGQHYKRGDLLPIHARCSCKVFPAFKRSDAEPPQGVPLEDDRGAPVVHEHGELGPVLTEKGHGFTGPAEVETPAPLKVTTPDVPELDPAKVKAWTKEPTARLRKLLERPKLHPLDRAEITAALERKGLKTARKALPEADVKLGTARPGLSDDAKRALTPKRWKNNTGDETISALRGEPGGARLAKALETFQSGSSRSIPRLRTDIEKVLSGGEVPAGRRALVDDLLGAINDFDAGAKPLHRGMRIPGNEDAILEKYAPGSDIDISLGSFTSDRKVAARFSREELGGQRAKGKKQTPVVVEWLGADKRALPIENLAKLENLNKEKEWLAAGRFRVIEARKQSGTVYLKVQQVERF